MQVAILGSGENDAARHNNQVRVLLRLGVTLRQKYSIPSTARHCGGFFLHRWNGPFSRMFFDTDRSQTCAEYLLNWAMKNAMSLSTSPSSGPHLVCRS